MADTRIMLTCKHCGAGMCIGKGYDGSYYTVNKNMFHDLNAFYEVHEQGKCSDDTDYSQDAKNHFVILEDGETLADVEPKSEVEKIFSEIDNWFELYSEREFSFAEEEASKEHLPESEAHDYALDIIKELRQLCVAELKKKYPGVEDGDE